MTRPQDPALPLSRRALLQGTAALALGASGLAAPAPAAAAAGKVVVGAFADGGLTPFKQTIIPLAKAEGFDIEFLEDEYGVTLEKWFADAKSGAGQYDLYLLDDPWVPQFGAADLLEDLGAGGVDGADKDWIGPMIDMGYWPPRQGPRVKGFETAAPKLVCVPFVGDLQTLTYRTDVYGETAPATWDEILAKGKAGVAAGKIKYPVVFRGVTGNPIVTSWYPIFLSFGGRFFDDKWNVAFNSEAGKASADFFVGALKQGAPPGVVEFDSDQEGAAILGGDAGAIIQYSGNALKADDPAQCKVVGKLGFGVVPKKVAAIAQMGIFIAGVPKSAPNKANAIAFLQWYASPRIQARLAEAGSIPVKRSAFAVPDPGNRLIPVALQQLDAGALPRPRTPDWAKVEELLGIQLNKALQAGSGGGGALDVAAAQVTDYLTQAGYYP
ncbi:extracellular solute-binding protein [Labrys wisconsinensis]|uniref:Multiple sugar transport system substrate-binding protein n=1 Tax=Labrys wisconsinensis TaxID=425677 RepID=A0ABU0JG61_9HYPH|nr:extracellular solute-binding protein [Labrys wisconsinensis]MDQ0473271.1 multiple sugar transport system substrate-binding protein [Labrys wisconsinensis]